MTNDELLEMARELNGRREPYALVTVVRAVAPTSAYLGAQAIVLADGTLHGWIGGGCAKDVVIGAAQSAIGTGEPKLVRISNDRIQPEDDVEQHTMSCASNGTIELFIQPYSPRSALCVLGSTPAADEARFLAERLRIRLADTPDEAPVVLVATQGQGDEEALERALNELGSARAHDRQPAQGAKAARRHAHARRSTRRSLRGSLPRRARMPEPRRRAKSRWWRSSACSRCCAVARKRLRSQRLSRRQPMHLFRRRYSRVRTTQSTRQRRAPNSSTRSAELRSTPPRRSTSRSTKASPITSAATAA